VSTGTNEAWLGTIRCVLDDGVYLNQVNREHVPRDQLTQEVICHKASFPMTGPLVTVARRKLGYRFASAEAAAILSGDNRVAAVAPYSKGIGGFSDTGYRFAGHYGPKFVDQEVWCAELLARDPASRQCVMGIWRERPAGSKDIPCTLSLQWLIRDGNVDPLHVPIPTLHCIATMRSSDVWLGIPYDVFTFSMMSAHLALVLREYLGIVLGLGTLHMVAGSRHLYGRDLDDARACLDEPTAAFKYASVDLTEFNSPDHLTTHLQRLADKSQWPMLNVPSLREIT
jgi:thymidylate synthase